MLERVLTEMMTFHRRRFIVVYLIALHLFLLVTLYQMAR